MLKEEKEMKTWTCDICGYEHYEQDPPEDCPFCMAPAEQFTEREE